MWFRLITKYIVVDGSFMLSSFISDPASTHSTAMRPEWWSHWPPAMSQNKLQRAKAGISRICRRQKHLTHPSFFDNNSNCFPKLFTKRNRFQNKKTQNFRQYLNKLIASSGSRHVTLTKFNDILRLHTWIPEVLESRTSVILCPQSHLVLVPSLRRLRGSGVSGDENA